MRLKGLCSSWDTSIQEQGCTNNSNSPTCLTCLTLPSPNYFLTGRLSHQYKSGIIALLFPPQLSFEKKSHSTFRQNTFEYISMCDYVHGVFCSQSQWPCNAIKTEYPYFLSAIFSIFIPLTVMKYDGEWYSSTGLSQGSLPLKSVKSFVNRLVMLLSGTEYKIIVYRNNRLKSLEILVK